MDSRLTLAVKEYAYSLGADLVGIANIGRYENAPPKMSPQGILPTAKSVIVCAIHHPDAAIELDGEVHPQVMGPYRIQYVMNEKLDVLSFRIGRMLDDLGYKTVPIASSNIWRYRGYKELDAIFAPDISHIYSAVCAGLGELGWNGLCITPEYGARNRFVSIITEAELTPTPLYSGEKLCDEFKGEFGGHTYLSYINALDGRQEELLKVVMDRIEASQPKKPQVGDTVILGSIPADAVPHKGK